MTPIEEQIEKLAEKFSRRFAETSHDLTGRDFDFLEWQALMLGMRQIAAELIPLVREECAKIALEDSEGCLRMAELCTGPNDADDARMHRMDSHVGKRIAAAIREGK